MRACHVLLVPSTTRKAVVVAPHVFPARRLLGAHALNVKLASSLLQEIVRLVMMVSIVPLGPAIAHRARRESSRLLTSRPVKVVRRGSSVVSQLKNALIAKWGNSTKSAIKKPALSALKIKGPIQRGALFVNAILNSLVKSILSLNNSRASTVQEEQFAIIQELH